MDITESECLDLFDEYCEDGVITREMFLKIIDDLHIVKSCDDCSDYLNGACTDYKGQYCSNNKYAERRWSPKINLR